jgi:hypothetical protein
MCLDQDDVSRTNLQTAFGDGRHSVYSTQVSCCAQHADCQIPDAITYAVNSLVVSSMQFYAPPFTSTSLPTYFVQLITIPHHAHSLSSSYHPAPPSSLAS